MSSKACVMSPRYKSPVTTTAELYQEALLPEPDISYEPTTADTEPIMMFDQRTSVTAAVTEPVIVTPNQPFMRTPPTPNRVVPVPIQMPFPPMALLNMELTTIYNGSSSRCNFSVNLARRLFASSVRRSSNVAG